jgi:hypothetical protein
MSVQPYPPVPPPEGPPRRRGRGTRIALVAGGIVAGALGATALGAHAAESNSPNALSAYASTPTSTSTGSSGSSGSSSPATARPDRGGPGPGGAAPVRSDEKSVTSAQEATLRAAALKAVPGGTVIRIETDSGDDTYEAHMKKSDGTLVTVKFDKNLKVTAVEDGMGK